MTVIAFCSIMMCSNAKGEETKVRKVTMEKLQIELNRDEQVQELLTKMGLRARIKDDEKLEVRLVVRKINPTNRRDYDIIYEVIPQEFWNRILSLDCWSENQKIFLTNFQESQLFGERWISIPNSLIGVNNPTNDYLIVHTIKGSIKRSLKKTGLPCTIVWKNEKMGIFLTKPKD